MNVLVAYATSEGHTRLIAEWTAEWLRARIHTAQVIDTAVNAGPLQVDEYEAFILAGSLHRGLHQASLVEFVRNNLVVLQRKPSALISASATAVKTDAASLSQANACVEAFVKTTGWKPTAVKPIGGAMMYTKYNFLLRWLMKGISKRAGGPTDTSRDYDFTDWKALELFLSGFLRQCADMANTQPSVTPEKAPNAG